MRCLKPYLEHRNCSSNISALLWYYCIWAMTWMETSVPRTSNTPSIWVGVYMIAFPLSYPKIAKYTSTVSRSRERQITEWWTRKQILKTHEMPTVDSQNDFGGSPILKVLNPQYDVQGLCQEKKKFWQLFFFPSLRIYFFWDSIANILLNFLPWQKFWSIQNLIKNCIFCINPSSLSPSVSKRSSRNIFNTCLQTPMSSF